GLLHVSLSVVPAGLAPAGGARSRWDRYRVLLCCSGPTSVVVRVPGYPAATIGGSGGRAVVEGGWRRLCLSPRACYESGGCDRRGAWSQVRPPEYRRWCQSNNDTAGGLNVHGKRCHPSRPDRRAMERARTAPTSTITLWSAA